MHSHRRRDDDILMEMVIFWSVGDDVRRSSIIYYFVVRNDGTLISYYGLSRNRSDDSSGRISMRTVREREELALNESDFAHISELVNAIVTRETLEYHALTDLHVRFIHNGNIYECNTVRSEPLHNLVRIIIELTPLSVF